MRRKRSTGKGLSVLVAAVLIGSSCLEALGQAEQQAGKAARAIPLEPLKTAPLEALSQGPLERKPTFPEDQVWIIGKEPPELIGGIKALHAKMIYPESAMQNGIQGKLMVLFLVNEEGHVENAVVDKPIGGGLDEEALRIARLARYKPGVQLELTPDGAVHRRPIRVHMQLPLSWHLNTQTYVTPRGGIR